MALPLSGLITMSMINTELGKSSNAAITLNDAGVRSLLGKPSGAISLSDAYGKTGAHWDAQTPIGVSLVSIVWCASLSLYAGIGLWGEIYTSPTGVTWTYKPDLYNKIRGSMQIFSGLLWTGSYLVATMYYNGSNLYTSPTGVTFTAAALGPNNPACAAGHDVTSGKVAQGCVGGYVIYSSNLGASWTAGAGTRGIGDYNNHNSIAANGLGTMWLVSGYPDTLASSTDLVTWVARTPPSFTSGKIYYLNGTWIVTSSSGNIYFSTNLTSWTETLNLKNLFAGQNSAAMPLVWNGSYYLAGGPNGQLAKSTDLVNWTSVGWLASLSEWATVSVAGLCWANNKWVATGYGGGLVAISNAGSQ